MLYGFTFLTIIIVYIMGISVILRCNLPKYKKVVLKRKKGLNILIC